eukprot:COSAG05_NODE_800_length_7226_cov_4.300126_3_plen_100_part_00
MLPIGPVCAGSSTGDDRGLGLGQPDSLLCSALVAASGGSAPPTDEAGNSSGDEDSGAVAAAPLPAVCSLEAFQWAWAVVTSRAFAPAILVPLQVRPVTL